MKVDMEHGGRRGKEGEEDDQLDEVEREGRR